MSRVMAAGVKAYRPATGEEYDALETRVLLTGPFVGLRVRYFPFVIMSGGECRTTSLYVGTVFEVGFFVDAPWFRVEWDHRLSAPTHDPAPGELFPCHELHPRNGCIWLELEAAL